MIAETRTTKPFRNVVFALTATLTGAMSMTVHLLPRLRPPRRPGARLRIRKSEHSQPGNPTQLANRRQPGSAAHQVVASGLRAGVAA